MNGKKDSCSQTFSEEHFKEYDYLLKEYSARTAFDFLNKLQRRVELIIRYPEIGKSSQLKSNVRSVTLQPHNRIFYRLKINSIELLCLFDMRKKKLPY